MAANLGALLRRAGRLQEAKQLYQWALEHCSWHPSLWLNAANCLHDTGDLNACAATLDAALQQLPSDPLLRLARARCWNANHQADQALPLLHSLVQEAEPPPGAWLELAVCLIQLQRLPEALDALARAQQQQPSNAHAAALHITTLKECGRCDDAWTLLSGLDQPLRQQPLLLAAKAALLLSQNAVTEAAEHYQHLCEVEPTQGDHWLHLACCQRQLKQVVAPWQTVQKGLKRNPGHRGLHLAQLQLAADLGDTALTTVLLNNFLGQEPTLSDAEHRSIQFLAAGYRLLPANRLQQLALRWEKQKQREGPGPLWSDLITSPPTQRRLRVGYLSTDFCNHPVGRFIAPVLELHQRERWCVVGLNAGSIQDPLTQRIRRGCDEWLDLGQATDLQAARMIADKQLDVLIELGGYTGGSRVGVLVHRPAPLQLSYLGYFAPTHLSCIDGWIGDSVLFEQLDDREHAGKLIKIPGGYMAYVPDVLPPPRDTGSRPFRFGCFNNSRKLTPQCLDLFSAVLEAVPTAELAIKSISFVEEAEVKRIHGLLVERGIPAERLHLMPWARTLDEHLSSYQEVDVALDPIPYGGATSSCEALWMGVPVVCMAGAGMVGRLSASLLSHANLHQWISSTSAGYVEIATELARAGQRHSDDRWKLRQHVIDSPLGNARRLAQSLENEFEDLIRRRANQREPGQPSG